MNQLERDNNNTCHTPVESLHNSIFKDDHKAENALLANSNELTGSSSTNMPSPPLSPYTRDIDISQLKLSRTSRLFDADLEIAQVLAPTPKYGLSKLVEITSRSNNRRSSELDDIKLAAGFQSSNTSLNSIEDTFPLENLENSHLVVSPYRNVSKKGFKRATLSFLNSYNFDCKKQSLNPVAKKTTRLRNYEASNNSRSRLDNSSSDNETNDYEKPRTRRLVRQNKFDLESDVESNVSRPSTPIKRRSVPKKEQSSPKRARTATPVVYNYDYRQIEDFCPSLDTLPSNNKSLRADWKGQSMDLSDDPLIDLLHPAEVVLASTLRLPCSVYLDSKRRIFFEKVKRMRGDLPFRRTDAQKSCKIDVNKASRLFAAFEKVGWFDERHFEKFL